MLTYLGILDRYRPRWMVWENVPGVLSSESGRDFGTFLGALGQLGYGWAYRSLDAQYFHLAQRRERVFVVGCLGDWRRAAEVLFERESLCGYPAPSREARESFTYDASPSLTASGRGTERTGESRGADCVVASTYWDGGDIADTLDASNASNASKQQMMPEKRRFQAVVTHALRADGFDASEDGTGRGTPLVPVAYRTSSNCGAWETGDRTDALTTSTDPTQHVVAFSCKDFGADAGEISPTLRSMNFDASHANGGGQVALAYSLDIHKSANEGSSLGIQEEHINAMRTEHPPTISQGWAVRRLTPRECERLQGFPDDYSLVPYRGKPMADGPRYKMLGNSMAVPCMTWIGERIKLVSEL